jgi:molybdopterin converting factor small subunit
VDVIVKLYGDLKPRSGEAEIVLALGAGSTIDDALQTLTAEKPELLKLLFDVQGDVRDTVNVFLNGTNARGLSAEQAALREGDTLFILTAFGGG